MVDLRSIPAAVVQGQDVSLHEVLYTLKLKGQLQPLLEEAIADRLLAAAAQERGLTITPEEKQKAADLYRRSLGLERADSTQRWLALNHLSADDMEAGLTRALLRQKFIDAIPAQRIQQFFDQNRARFDRARLAQIVLPSEGLAQELLLQIKEEGKDFAELARQNSTDGRTKKAGGRLGVVLRRRLLPRVEQAVFQAKAGDIVGPIALGSAFLLIKVEAFLPAQLTPRLAALIRRRLFNAWLRGRARAARIQVKLHDHL